MSKQKKGKPAEPQATEAKPKRKAGAPVEHPYRPGCYLHNGVTIGGGALHDALANRDADLIDSLSAACERDFIDTYGKEFNQRYT